MASQLPFTVLAGYGIGYGLDYVFGTSWLRILFLFIGIIGGVGQIIAQALKDSKTK